MQRDFSVNYKGALTCDLVVITYVGTGNPLMFRTARIIQSMVASSITRHTTSVALASPLLIVAVCFVSVSLPRYLFFLLGFVPDECAISGDEAFYNVASLLTYLSL